MLNITKNSKKVELLLNARNRIGWSLGVIGKYYYTYGRDGAYKYEARPNYKKDLGFPGKLNTKQRITTKDLINALNNEYMEIWEPIKPGIVKIKNRKCTFWADGHIYCARHITPVLMQRNKDGKLYCYKCEEDS